MLVEHRESRFPAFKELGFRHALLRQGAYALVTDADRQTGHRRAAEWLVAVGEADPLVLAEHFRRGDAPEVAAKYAQVVYADEAEGIVVLRNNLPPFYTTERHRHHGIAMALVISGELLIGGPGGTPLGPGQSAVVPAGTIDVDTATKDGAVGLFVYFTVDGKVISFFDEAGVESTVTIADAVAMYRQGVVAR